MKIQVIKRRDGWTVTVNGYPVREYRTENEAYNMEKFMIMGNGVYLTYRQILKIIIEEKLKLKGEPITLLTGAILSYAGCINGEQTYRISGNDEQINPYIKGIV